MSCRQVRFEQRIASLTWLSFDTTEILHGYHTERQHFAQLTNDLEPGHGIQAASTSISQTPNNSSSSTTPTQSLHPLAVKCTTMASTLSTSYIATSTTSTHSLYPTIRPNTANDVPSPPPTPTYLPINLSPSAAIGIGVAAGVIGTVISLTAGLFIYRCWKVWHSPSVRYYEQARLWKGFTPATQSTARNTLVELNTPNTYFTDLRSPMTPSSTLSPPLDERGRNGQESPNIPRHVA